MLTAATPAVGVSYKYDTRNLPQSFTRTNGVVTNYIFDSRRQLLSIVHSKGLNPVSTLTYTYDAIGNRSVISNDISQALITKSGKSTVDNGNELLTDSGTVYTYDANGNRLTETNANTTLVYAWDGRNRLASIKDTIGSVTSLQYDFNDNLLQVSQASSAGSTIRHFVVDSLTNVVSLTDASGLPVAVLTGRRLDSHYASVDSSGNVIFGIRDALGDDTAFVNSSGTITASLYYEPFGQTTGVAPIAFPFAYTGRVPITGNIYYYRHRYYDTGVGRFASEDPIGPGSGFNLSAYVRNNPINRWDPLGLCDLILGPAIRAGLDAGGLPSDELCTELGGCDKGNGKGDTGDSENAEPPIEPALTVTGAGLLGGEEAAWEAAPHAIWGAFSDWFLHQLLNWEKRIVSTPQKFPGQ